MKYIVLHPTLTATIIVDAYGEQQIEFIKDRRNGTRCIKRFAFESGKWHSVDPKALYNLFVKL